MKRKYTKISLLISSYLLLFANISIAQNYQWAMNIGQSGYDISHNMFVDQAGYVYITGGFQGTNVDFDPSSATHYLSSKGGSLDIFVAKYTSTGQYIWAIDLGGSTQDEGEGITVDPSGNVYVTGYFRGNNAEFDPAGVNPAGILNSNGQNGTDPGYGGDIFLAKYSANGAFDWAFNIGGPSINESGQAISCDASGNVYLGGYFSQVDDFDPSPAIHMLNSSSGTLFLAKYDTNGQYQWAFNMGGNSVNNAVFSLKLDSNSNIYIDGFFQGLNDDFDPSPSQALLSSQGNNDIYVAKYNSAGQYQWAFDIGGSGNDAGRGLSLDENGNIYISGDFTGSNIDFDPSPNTYTLNAVTTNIFFAKYTTNGEFLWAKSLNSSSIGTGWDLEYSRGNLFLTGAFQGTTDFNPDPVLVDNITSNGGNDIYVAKYDSAGKFDCAFNIGAGSDDQGFRIRSDTTGAFYITGFFALTVNFDPGSSVHNLISNGNQDAFLAKYIWNGDSSQPTGILYGNTICKGNQGQLTFNATSGKQPFTIVYKNGTNDTVVNVQSGVPFDVIPNPTITTNYTLVTILDNSACYNINNPSGIIATIGIDSGPPVSAGSDTATCFGDSVQLSASGIGKYNWMPSAGLSNDAIPNPIAIPPATTKYFLTITDSNGCTAKDSVLVTIKPPPAISLNSTALSICPGDSVSLNATGGGTYLWAPTVGLSNPSIANPEAYYTATTKYTVKVTGSNGCSAKDSVQITANPKPSFGINPVSSQICLGDSVSLTASGGDNYQWYPPDFVARPSAASTIVYPQSNTDYKIIISSNQCNITDSVFASVLVNPALITSVTKSNDIDCDNAHANLTASGGIAYHWFPASGLSNPNISNPVASPVLTTTYHVTVTNNTGCMKEDSVQVKVSSSGGLNRFLMPSAFTPNGDGLNDCFGLKNWGPVIKLDFAVYNRWGNKVFSTADPSNCWDGTSAGIPQPAGAYVYQISAQTLCGNVYRKGTLVLIR